jgi:predicted metal-dependent hydrolase
MSHADPKVQSAMKKVAEKALGLEAERLLPQRLETLAQKYNCTYASVTTRKLTSRWGSCDSRKQITLSIYLMQLSWELIDYVIIHELAHTTHQHHQADFWEEVERMLPSWKTLRKELKSKPTDVFATNF